MSEDKESDWLAELAKNTEALRSQIDQGGETLRRQVELLGRAAEQFIRGARWPTPGIGPVPPFQRRVVRAAGAVMGELLPPRESVVHQVALHETGAGVDTLAIAIVATASGSAPMPQVRVATPAERGAGLILALVLLWLVVLVMPAAAWDANLPPEVQALVDVYDGVLANVAVAITFDILRKRKSGRG